MTARDHDGVLVGFVNVAWDGGDHSFLLDTKTAGVGSAVVSALKSCGGLRVMHQVAGCEWLHVDFEPHLASFYLDACGFRRTDAGLIHLRSAD